MRMNAPRPPDRYDPAYQTEINRLLGDLAGKAFVRGERVDVGAAGIVLTAPNGSRWLLTVDNSGALGTTAL